MKAVHLEYDLSLVRPDERMDESEIINWHNEERMFGGMIGYLIDETRDAIVIASVFDKKEEAPDYFKKYSHIRKIPKRWIRSRKDLTI